MVEWFTQPLRDSAPRIRSDARLVVRRVVELTDVEGLSFRVQEHGVELLFSVVS